MRVVENLNLLDCNELIIRASLARKASSRSLGFTRQDYPDLDPPEWHKFVTIRQGQDGVKTDSRPLNFAGSLGDNYEDHNPDYRGFLKQD